MNENTTRALGFRPLTSGLLGLVDEFWGAPAVDRRSFTPAIDVTEREDAYVVSAELPGATANDVNVEIEDGVLSLRGEKRSERSGEKEHSRWVERSYGTFSRSFTLPRNADPEKVEASFKDGVLHLTISKREEAKPKTIEIHA